MRDCASLAPRCGDAIIQENEACDDGDAEDGDGCNIDCAVGGTLIWSQLVDGDAHSFDQATGIAANLAGDIIVVGDESYAAGDYSAWISKYDSKGRRVWAHTYDGGRSSSTVARAVAVDDQGSIFACGFHNTSGDRSIWVRALEDDSEMRWTDEYESPGTEGLDRCYAASVGAADDLIVAGSHESVGTQSDVWFRQMSAATGSTSWTRTFDGSDKDDYAWAAAHDVGEGVLLAGSQTSVGGTAAWLRKYDSVGTLVWGELDDGAADRSFRGVTIDADGNIVVVGYEATPGFWSVLIRMYRADGSIAWSAFEDFGGTPGTHQATAVAMAPNGDLIVGANDMTGGIPASDAWVARYSSEGTPIWSAYPAADDNSVAASWIAGVAVDASGAVYLVGYQNAVNETTGDAWIARVAP